MPFGIDPSRNCGGSSKKSSFFGFNTRQDGRKSQKCRSRPFKIFVMDVCRINNLKRSSLKPFHTNVSCPPEINTMEKNPKPKPKVECVTRWNSCYLMLFWIKKYKEAINLTYTSHSRLHFREKRLDFFGRGS